MSFTCDGVKSACKTRIKFYVDESGLHLPNGKVDLTASQIGRCLKEILSDLSIEVSTPTPPIHNLCQTCWLNKAEEWVQAEKTPSNPVTTAVYAPARAKTDSQGIFLQNDSDAFLNNMLHPDPERNPQPEPIMSCVVHEMMHYWSSNHKGLMGRKDGGIDWDEAITDSLAYPVYSKALRGMSYPGGVFSFYGTPYGTTTVWIQTGKTKWETLVNGRWGKQFTDTSDSTFRDSLPASVIDYFKGQMGGAKGGANDIGGNTGPPPPPPFKGMPPPPGMGMGAVGGAVKLGTGSKDIWELAVRIVSATWYFNGTDSRVEGYRNFDDFVAKREKVFCNQMQTVFGSFGEKEYRMLD